MEIISTVGGFISGVGSAICSGISHICSGAMSLVSRMPVFEGFAKTALSLLPTLFPHTGIIEVIALIVAVIGAVAEALGLKEEEKDTPEEMGMKAEQAEKGRDDFESDAEYIAYLHEIELDREKVKELTEEQRAAYALIGTKIYADGIKEKLGVKDEISPRFILECAKLGIKADEFIAYVKAMDAEGLKGQEGFHEFLHGETMKTDDKVKVTNAMVSALGELYPDMSPDEIAEKIEQMEAQAQAVSQAQ